MTVTAVGFSGPTFIQTPGNGAATVYTFPFLVSAAGDVIVGFVVSGVYTLQPPVTYAVAGVGNTGGGTVTFTVAPPFGTIVDIRSQIPETQPINFANLGGYYPESTTNAVDRITRLVTDMYRFAYLFSIHGPDTENIPWTQLPAPAGRAGGSLIFDSNGLPTIGFLTAVNLNQSIFNSFLATSPIGGVQTSAENAAGVTPVNLQYGPGVVDRYGTNTTPGITSMAAAFQAAINQAKKGGLTVTYGATAPYLIDAQIDCTTAVGTTNFAITIRGESNNMAITTNAPYRPPIIIKQNGTAGFDCTGVAGINFQNMSITTDTVTFPKVCFLLARNTNGTSQIARFDNIRIYGMFSDSVLYNYGSEDDVHVGCYYGNVLTTGATKTVRITGNNVSGLASSFTTIATGTLSTIDHSFLGCQFINLSTNAAADLIYLEACGYTRFSSCWASMGASGGRSIVYADLTNADCSNVMFRDWITESSSVQSYFIDISNNAHTCTNWRLDDVTNFSSSYLINVAGASPLIDEWNLNAIFDVNNHGINIPGTIQNSVIYYFGPMIIGTSSGNELHGSPPVWTITTRSNDKWYDWTASTAWTPNTSALTITGALTVSSVRVQYEGSTITVTCQLSAVTSIVCAAGTLLGGLPHPPRR